MDSSPPGAGRVWRTDQSRNPLMNTVATQVTVFTDHTVVMRGPVRPGPSLADWAGRLRGTAASREYADWVHPPASGAGDRS